MKKWLWYRVAVLFGAILLLPVGLTGCGKAQEEDSALADQKLKVVCTIFPEYDWAKEILGEQAENVELTLLLKNGSDLHSYQPTVWDMVKISEADLFIYVGGESDFWVEDALANAKNPDMKVLNLMELLEDSVKEEEHVEGMQAVRSHDHEEDGHGAGDEPEPEESHRSEAGPEPEDGHGAGDAHDHEEAEYDEHVWLSLRNAKIVCEAVRDALCGLDTEHRSLYEQNCAAYVEKLGVLDEAYAQVTEQTARPVLLFGDRFPFRYLTDDYGLSYYAAFAGCSAETEASFETITFLAGKVDELSLPAVLAIDGSDRKIAGTIAENTRTQRAEVLVLDSMQSVSEEDMENGTTYLSIMESNLEVLKKALPAERR